MPLAVADGFARAVEEAAAVGVTLVAAGLKDGAAPTPDAEALGGAVVVEGTGAVVDPTGAGTASGPLALAELFRFATTAITSTSATTAAQSMRTRRIQ